MAELINKRIFPTLKIENAQGFAPGEVIVVRVDHDDGYLATAEVMGVAYRCHVNTMDRAAYWDVRAPQHPDGWQGIDVRSVDMAEQRKESMRRAALAGLVAYGVRS